MNARIKSFIVPVLLSGAWGGITFLLGCALLNDLPMGYAFFYPILLVGVVLASALGGGWGVSGARAALTGFISGFVYLLVSPMFPLFGSVLAGASLGGGLSRGGGRLGGIISTVKGMIIFPLVILSGEFLGVLVLVSLDSVVLSCVFWGAWLGLGVCLIRTPVFGRRRGNDDPGLSSGLEEFRSEAREIAGDLREFDKGQAEGF
jgi:hypothetical protein